jgi:hypothetical protein
VLARARPAHHRLLLPRVSARCARRRKTPAPRPDLPRLNSDHGAPFSAVAMPRPQALCSDCARPARMR